MKPEMHVNCPAEAKLTSVTNDLFDASMAVANAIAGIRELAQSFDHISTQRDGCDQAYHAACEAADRIAKALEQLPG